MIREPRLPNAEARQSRDLLVNAGFQYDGTTSDDHFRYVNPLDGFWFNLAGTPKPGTQLNIVRDMLRKRYGIGQRGGFDREAQRARGRREREQREANREAVMRANADTIARRNAEDRLMRRYYELRSIQSLMGAKGSCF